jgi:hypothetical protein
MTINDILYKEIDSAKEISNTKGGFFSESVMCFSNLHISKKNIANHYPQLEI